MHSLKNYTLITTLSFKKPHLALAYSEENAPILIFDHNIINNLENTPELHSLFTEEKAASLQAKIICFFLYNLRFSVIEDIEKYKKQYILNQQYNDQLFGSFNLEELTLPSFKEGHLVFFVEDLNTRIPLKVTCSYPLTGHSSIICEPLQGSFHD